MTTDTTQPMTVNDASLHDLGAVVSVPDYDREKLTASIVHIGVGGFHRAHLATYIHELCQAGHRDWAIVGAGVLPHDRRMADVLAAQDGLYCLITRGASDTTVDVIGSIVEYIYAEPAPELLVSRIADASTQIVSLTITEGGYPIDDVTGTYLPDSASAGPGSAFALIAAGLDARRRAEAGPVTILSCDNIMSNGDAARASVMGEAASVDIVLCDWIAENVTFPNSMVDRITPVSTDADRAWLTDNHAIIDQWPVVAEPFRQWVIEDRFAGARPPFEELDVIVTADVEPYEIMKLRLLNAGHSCLAYLAALVDLTTVDEALADDAIRRYLAAFLNEEAKPSLPSVPGIDVDAYIDSLIERFSNPAIGDQIARLCLDGSAKFPKFLLPTVRAQLATDGSIRLSALALAGWCEYLSGTSLSGKPIEPSPDPQLDEAIRFAGLSQHDPKAFLGFGAVFDDELASSPRFVETFERAIGLLRGQGVGSAVDTLLEETQARHDESRPR